MILINYFDCINEIMIKDKSSFSIRWIGVFNTIKKLVEKKLLSPYNEINFVGEIHINNRRKVQIRCCNMDNRISRLNKYLCFFDKITPEKFDFLICVYLDRYKNVQGHYIFTREEVISYFPPMMGDKGIPCDQYKGLYIPLYEKLPEPLFTLIDNSFENWDKLKQAA